MKHDSFAARITVVYFIVTLGWIIFSDDLTRLIAGSPSEVTVLHSIAGAAFVVVSTVLLYLFVTRKIRDIEATRQKLADSAAYYELLISQAADSLMILTTEGRIVSTNQSFTALTGYSGDELTGAHLSIIVPPEALSANPLRYREVIEKGGDVVENERPLRRKDGSTVMTHWRTKLLPNGLLQSIVRDITDRVEAEAALRRYADRLQVLADATRSFTEATGDFTRLAQEIVNRLADLIGDASGIWIALDDSDHVPLIASHIGESVTGATVEGDDADLYFVRGEGAIGQVFETGQPLLVERVPPERRQNRTIGRWQSIFEKMPIFSMIYVPIRASGQPLGVLALARVRPERALYTEDDLRLAQEIADRAALALSNAQSLQMAQRELAVRKAAEAAAQRNAARLQMLAEASSAFAEATGAYALLAETIARRLTDMIGDLCRIWMAPADEPELRLVAAYDSDPAYNALLAEHRPELGYAPAESFVGRVFEGGRPLLFSEVTIAEAREDLTPQWRPLFDQLKLRSLLFVPLRAHGKTLGVLSLARHRPDQPIYTGDELELVQELADRASMAISNAQLVQVAQHELAERIEAERALHESEGRFRLFADTIPTLIWMLGTDGRLIYINQSWTTYTGHPVHTALGWGWGAFMHPDDRDSLTAAVAELARQRQPFSIDFRLKWQDGNYRWMLSTGTPHYTDEGEFVGFIGSSIDLTERHEAETALQTLNDDLERRVAERTAELTSANEQLRELDQMRTKFVAHVTHDLRNPVASLSMRLYIMARTPERYAEHVQVLTEQVERLKHLIDSVLDLSRIDLSQSTVKFEPVDFNAIVENEVFALTTHAQDVGLQLVCRLTDDKTTLWGAPNQLAQVVANLVGNAIHYTPAGRVEVTTEVDEADRLICLRVRDTGLGIAPEDVPHLFERFYRGRTVTENDLPGSGLGLSIVKEVVEIHHGRVEVESAVGEGTTFTIWLPAVSGVSLMS